VSNETQTDSQCVHHWVIEKPNGPVSYGKCKNCGEHSEFKNSIQGSGWDRGPGTTKPDNTDND
tara:strand:- start:4063 stop:4251 length:189 start_codon:yes stop_codon:yes gene_type:complete